MGDTDTTESTEAVETATETQGTPEALGEGGIKALQAEREARKQADNARKEIEAKLAAANAEIERFQAGERTELENAQHAAQKQAEATAEAVKRAEAAEAALLRFEVAQAKGLTGEALDLLTGTTREELEAKADSILKIMDSHKNTVPVVPGEGHSPEVRSGPEQDFANAMRAFF